MNASDQSDTDQTTAPTALWRVAEAFMHILHALFGDPSHVAAQHTLTLKAHQLLASWLRAGEAMMRRLLLIEAAAYSKPNTHPLLRAARKRTRRLMHFYPETPESWRVSFRCFSSPVHGGSVSARSAMTKGEVASNGPRPFIFREDRKPHVRAGSASKPNRRARRQAAKREPMLRQDREWMTREPLLAFRSAWPLAERYEALRRVFSAPLAFVARLARRLHATPHRVRELLGASLEAPQHINDFGRVRAAAEASARRFNSS